MSNLTERSALISVFNKDGIDKIASKLASLKVKILSTISSQFSSKIDFPI